MYFLIHTQILKDSSPITAFSYNTMAESLSALYSGMAYDVASDVVLRSWAKVCTESGQVIKEEEYVKVNDQTTTEAEPATGNETPSNSATDTSSDQAAANTTTDASGEQSTAGTPADTTSEKSTTATEINTAS